ncbi:hypothetical protein CC1G_00091 [Coprinopsis cinerea okayama7|uniref:F-box domain-containing protein n=1 Tax=Coprinopsis cinerea (strain Okayama-7 / 130 / ATCC MYA-4618 / FGSC 9003) TaxID=240176 RepID=A8NWQ2_COPC7|nr:hypothetical protein CC1G_00091 [Coprinopsis cinerea okayama7\|eukprot:XP_001836955.1 hypothetical protein CC1G_00091 [Coprinopsis cinerea okayama7\
MLSTLPFELLHAIADSVDDRRDLVALARCCSILNAVANRVLYRHISLTANKNPLAVANVLEQNPHLARHVRSFAIVVPPTFSPPTHAYSSLANALAHMLNIESLKLTLDPALSWVLPTAPNLAFPRLRDFTSLFPLDHNTSAFLAKTPALLSLELNHDLTPASSPAPLPASSLPRLQSFAGSSQAAQAIVPGRPVSSISMHSGDLTEFVLHSLAKSTAAVSFLDATTASLPLPLLETMAIAIPELQELRLATTYNLWDEWFNTPFIQNIKNALISMDNLKTAEVSGMLWRWLNKEGRVLANEPQLPASNDDDDLGSNDSDSSYFMA